ncbi:UDP-glucose dehydrogenase family protein [Cohnella yongneupensis]|uniref:UDP-glucose 6-dehydrogenase n=1 Tax=Cohnella yongneupensis TaxID=425006 RepID=A0ABW0R4U0_9BACL
MNIAVAGVGYVGLVTAVCLAEQGHRVTCLDIDEEKIRLLRQGKCSIYESELEEMMDRNRDRLVYTTDGDEAYRWAEVIIISVGTPEKKDGSANLKYIHDVVRQIARSVERDCVIAVKSTVPVGTNDKLAQMLEDQLRDLRKDVRIRVVSNPEFLSQGTAVKDTLHASRIVLGAEDEQSVDVMKRLYESFNCPIVVTDRRSAEMIKYAANDFLALKISYMNEIANLCEIVGANVEDVAAGMGLDKRIGDRFLNAGIGYGGSCFPKDTKALHWLANYNDYELKTIKAAIEVNEAQKIRLMKKARKYFHSFSGLNIAILGVTFKPGTDDLREAPSLANIPFFLEDGARLQVWDPVGMDNLKKIYDGDLTYCASIEESLLNADACFIFTEWQEIKALDLRTYARLMKRPLVFDGRNCYAPEEAKAAGIRYESIGRSGKQERNVLV